MTIQKIDVNNGKYTVVFDDKTGEMTALRYGEPWNKNIQGDNLVYWLAMELQEARGKIESLNEFANNPSCVERRELQRQLVEQGYTYEDVMQILAK